MVETKKFLFLILQTVGSERRDYYDEIKKQPTGHCGSCS